MFINKLACHKLASIAFSTKKLPNFYNNQSLQRAFSCIVGHSTNLATLHSRVIVGNCSMEYEYKLLRQLTTTVGAIYALNRARATHCRATRSDFAHISE